MEKEDFLETCVVLSALDRDAILKTILKEKYNFVMNVMSNKTSPANTTSNCQLPEGLDLLVHNPAPDNFAEYAFALCSLQDSKEAVTRHLLSIHFDAAVQSAISRPRVRTRQSKQKAEEDLPAAPSSKKTRSSPDLRTNDLRTNAAEALCSIQYTLPSKLNLFTDGKAPMTVMSEIIARFFPGMVLVWPGIYRKGSDFVLLVVDNGRYNSCWRSAGVQNKLTWFTSGEDVDRDIFDKITSKGSVVHVVRKRNSEMRYMGKCQQTEDIDREAGSCVMYIA